MQKIRKNSGITLVSLIVTIIILMILAGIVIATVTGNNSILSKSKQARDAYQNSANEEKGRISSYENEIDKASIDVASSREGTVTLSKEEYNNLKNANNYSLEETKIGTWIDGKIIYRKVIKVTIPGSTPHGINNFDTLVNFSLKWYDTTDNVWYDRFRLWDDNYGIAMEGVNVTSTYINIGTSRYNEIDWSARTTKAYVTLEYTKTTD